MVATYSVFLFLYPFLCCLLLGVNSVSDSDVTYFLYNDSENGTQLTDLEDVDAGDNLAILIHGWSGAANQTWVIEMARAFVDEKNYNVIAVDWSGLSSLLYTSSVADVPGVGDLVGQLIVNLYSDYGLNLSSLEVVGHSLGAHVAGFAGNWVQDTLNQSIGRITATDPAGPLYQYAPKSQRLDASDADLVVAIHTDAGVAGYSGSIGDIDFFPNGGTPSQPGCLEELFTDFEDGLSCSHERSGEIYIEAIYNPDGFVSTQCTSYAFYKLGWCSRNPTVTIGESLTIDDSGNYYLSTNSESPFSEE